MRILFKWLFSKVKPIYIIPILIIVGFLSIFIFPTFISSNILIKAEFPLDKSPNPEASKHFINAMEHKTKIANLHKSVDYDNPIMKPFLDDLYFEYEKGKSLLPKNSAEDVYWYVILFRGIHGIGGYPQRKDMSLSYKNMYSKEEYKQHYQEIVNKIKRLATDDFNFDVPRITQYKYEFMVNLIGEVMSLLGEYTYEDNKAFLNKEYLQDITDIYVYYKNFSKKYLPLANKQNENIVRDIYMKIRLSTYILTFKIQQTRKANCEDIEYRNLIKNIKLLKQMSLNPKYKNQTFYYEGIFHRVEWVYSILEVSEKYCPKLKKDTEEILKYVNPKLRKRLNKEK
ncbi:hypothetical protein [Halarcobacter bivalviorum]|uniref:Uncharacterized protein n=1 Tax=Halarcobacter bivalviorum TaxID=663364 RepID=A0AAX2AB21_9BACT|nr:hypothetical protein [Halarcobacter bivalviorum]AXH12593.1 hypothetical protein ABIV_1603 [Halarcobacter bivalviorum]RXK10483.1 hypothetical protein CRV05_04185 [Halarcobacter bivalviorum]